MNNVRSLVDPEGSAFWLARTSSDEPRPFSKLNDLSRGESSKLVSSSTHMGEKERDFDRERAGDSLAGRLIGEDRLSREDRRGRGGDRDRRFLRGESLRWRSRTYRRGDFERERRRLLLLLKTIGRDSRAREIGLSRRDLGDGVRRLRGDLDRRGGEWRLLWRGERERLDDREYRDGSVNGEFDRERERVRSRVGGSGAGGISSEPELTDITS